MRRDHRGCRRTVEARHAEVHQDEVGGERLGERDALGAVGSLAHDDDVGLLAQEPGQARSHDGMVVHEQHANHGTLTLTVVPVPGAESTAITPPTPSTRARNPSRP